MSNPHLTRPVIDGDVFYLLEIEIVLLAVTFLWSLIGLLIWLELYGEFKPRRRFSAFFLTFLCGPSAWLVSAWTLAHRRRVLVQSKVVLSKAPGEMQGRN